MPSAERRGQVEPLPALFALAAFAIALSLYGTTLHSLPGVSETPVPEATVTTTLDTISEGTVVRPDRLGDLDGTIPEGTPVVVRADGQTWRWGPDPDPNGSTVLRHVLVQTPHGAEPGILRVTG